LAKVEASCEGWSLITFLYFLDSTIHAFNDSLVAPKFNEGGANPWHAKASREGGTRRQPALYERRIKREAKVA